MPILRRRRRLDPHAPLIGAVGLVFDHPVDQCVKSEVAAHPDVASRMNPGADLANQDVAGANGLAGVNLDAAMLSRAVAAVARRALSFLMRHEPFSLV